ncbi:MAG TPA: BatD family protein [Mariprofundaceae bacterium]|nr:BatD family protein [Mariprofundaceae bacterium]
MLLLLLLPASATAAGLVATVDHNTIGKNDMILLSVRLTGGDGDFQLDTSPLDKDFYVIPKGSGRKSGEWREKRFQLGPKHVGVLTIPPLNAVSNGRTMTSQAFTVTVRNQSGSVDDARVWIETHIDRASVWQRQQLVYRFTVLSTNPIVSPSLVPPDFSAFQVEAVEENMPGEQVVDGRRVQTADYIYLLFPKQSGDLSITGPVVRATLVQTVKSWRVAAGQASIGDEKHVFRSKTATGATQQIRVRPLPAAAKDLPVGVLSIHSGISEAQAVAGEPLTWTVTVQGNGMAGDSLPDVKPLMKLGGSFKVYAETPDISLNKRQDGLTATAIWRQVVLPQKAGSLSLPPIEVSYFNSEDGRVEKVSAPAVHLAVSPPRQDEGEVVFQADPSRPGHVLLVPNTSRWWKWIAVAASLLWLLTLALWLLPVRRLAGWFRNRSSRRSSLQHVLSAGDAFEQFTRLKLMLGLPARLSPLGFLDMYPQLTDGQVGPWLERLEQGRYASGGKPPTLDDRTIRQIRAAVERHDAETPARLTPSQFGRIGVGR